jgi:hypothetical protein
LWNLIGFEKIAAICNFKSKAQHEMLKKSERPSYICRFSNPASLSSQELEWKVDRRRFGLEIAMNFSMAIF